MDEKPARVTLRDVNDYLTCGICHGYLIDAMSNSNCSHSFCRSCVLRNLDREKFCPVCRKCENIDTLLSELSYDQILQTIVFKVVPNLYHAEIQRRREFLKSSTDLTGSGSDTWRQKQRRALRLYSKKIYTGAERINVCLVLCESFPFECNKFLEGFSGAKETDKQSEMNVREIAERRTEKQGLQRYLLCPAKMTIGHLKKYIRYKFDMDDGFEIEIFHSKDSLLNEYNLIDVAYIYYNSEKVAHMTLQYIVLDTVCDGKPLTSEPECNNNSLTKQKALKRKLDSKSPSSKSDDDTVSLMRSDGITDGKKSRTRMFHDVTFNDRASSKDSGGQLNESDMEPVEERRNIGLMIDGCKTRISENLNFNTGSIDLNCPSVGEVSLAFEENSGIVTHIEGTSSFSGAVSFLESKDTSSVDHNVITLKKLKVLGCFLNRCCDEGNEKISGEGVKERASQHISPYKNCETPKEWNLYLNNGNAVEKRDFYHDTARDLLESDSSKVMGHETGLCYTQEIEHSKDSDAEIDTEIRRIAANVAISDENSMNEDSESRLPSPYQDHGETVLADGVGRGHGNFIDSIMISQLFAPSISTGGVELSVGNFLVSSVHAPFEYMGNSNNITQAATGLVGGSNGREASSCTEQIQNSDFRMFPNDCAMFPLHNTNSTLCLPYPTYFPVGTTDKQMSSGSVNNVSYFREFPTMNPIFTFSLPSHYDLSNDLNTSTKEQHHSSDSNLCTITDIPVFADNSDIADTNTLVDTFVATDSVVVTNGLNVSDTPVVTDSHLTTDASISFFNGPCDIEKPVADSFESRMSGNMDLSRCSEAALEVVICTNASILTGSANPLDILTNDERTKTTVVDKSTWSSEHLYLDTALNILGTPRSPKEDPRSAKDREKILINHIEADFPQTSICNLNSSECIVHMQDNACEYSVVQRAGSSMITNEHQSHENSACSDTYTETNQLTRAPLCETSGCKLFGGIKVSEQSCSVLNTNELKEIQGINQYSVNTNIIPGIIASEIAPADNTSIGAEMVSNNHKTITNILCMSIIDAPMSSVEKIVSKTIVKDIDKEQDVQETFDAEKSRVNGFPERSVQPKIASPINEHIPTRRTLFTVQSEVKSERVNQNGGPKFLQKNIANIKDRPNKSSTIVLSSVSASWSSASSLLSQPSSSTLSSSSLGTTAAATTVSPKRSLLSKPPALSGTKCVETSCNGHVSSKISVGTQTNIDLLGRYFKRRVNPVNSFQIAGKILRSSGKERLSKSTKTSLPVTTTKYTSSSSMPPTVTLSVGGGPIVSQAAIWLSGHGAPILLPAINGKSTFLITVPGNFSFPAQNGIRPNMTLIQTRLNYSDPRSAATSITTPTMAPLIFHQRPTTNQNMVLGRTMRPPLHFLVPSAASAPRITNVSRHTPIIPSLNGSSGFICKQSLDSNQSVSTVSVMSQKSPTATVATTVNNPHICALTIPSQIPFTDSLPSLYRMDSNPATKIGLVPVTIQSHSSGARLCVVTTSSSTSISSNVSYPSLSAATFPTFVLSNATPSALQNQTSLPYGGSWSMRSNLIATSSARTASELNSGKSLSDNSLSPITGADCSTGNISSTSHSLSSPTAFHGLSKLGARHISVSNIPHVGNKFTVTRKGSDSSSPEESGSGPRASSLSAPAIKKSLADISVSFQFDAKVSNCNVAKGQIVEGASVSLIRAILERNLTVPYNSERRILGMTAITQPKMDTVSDEVGISKSDSVTPLCVHTNNRLVNSPVNALNSGRAKRSMSLSDELCLGDHNVQESFSQQNFKKSKSFHVLVQNGSNRHILDTVVETEETNASLVMDKSSISNSSPFLSGGCIHNKSTSGDGRTTSPSDTDNTESFIKLRREIPVSGVVTRSQRATGRTNEGKDTKLQNNLSPTSATSAVCQINAPSRRGSTAEANLKIISPPRKKRRRYTVDSPQASAKETTTTVEDSDLQTPLLVAVFRKQCNIGSEMCPTSSENNPTSSCAFPVIATTINTTKLYPSTRGLSTKSLLVVETDPFIDENKLSSGNNQMGESLRQSTDNHCHSHTTLSSTTINRHSAEIFVSSAPESLLQTVDKSHEKQTHNDESKNLAANSNRKPGWTSMAVQTRCGMVALPKKVYTYFGSAMSHEHMAAREKNVEGQVANSKTSTNPPKEDVTHVNGTVKELKRKAGYCQQLTSPYLRPNDDVDDDPGSQDVAPPINQLRRMCNFIKNGSREKSPTVEIELLPPRLTPFT